ncbi:uncharacterized protein MEPE_03866 [Melanopsichium pennsylvanicum]|uniref:Ras modification protein ERF4 n=1 Tax=Melanopsichium pennsylvanicum TaxID=63383 RepID=A0AAJ5C5V5_9BASI|nr:uncharacterized protein MEPE_03866 [Melanopsichium pennsylvanicum]
MTNTEKSITTTTATTIPTSKTTRISTPSFEAQTNHVKLHSLGNEQNTAAATNAAAAAYPHPVSSYYFGPPDSTRTFGSGVTGKPGVTFAKEIVRIERDYSAGELPQFHSSFPLELEDRISPTTLSEIVNDINQLLIDAHNPTHTWIDNIVAILTFYLSSIMLGTHYKKTIEKLNNYIDKVNKDLLHPVGLALVNPVKTAFLFIEVEYY